MSHPTINSSRRDLYLYLGLLGLFLFSIILRGALTLNREIDIDEFQHLHAAWMVSQHYVIYKDFWENHTPLFYYLLLPLFRLCREGPFLVLIARVIMSCTACGILYLTYALARIHHDRLTSSLAVLVLSYMFIFMGKSIEVRPDQLVLMLWLGALLIYIRSLSKGQSLALFYAGFLLGVAYLFSPKALLPCAAMSLTFPVLSYLQGSGRAVLRFLKMQGSFTVGFLIPVSVCLAFFYHAGTLKEMLSCTVLDNFTYPNNYRPTYLLNLRNICFFLLAFAGLIIHLRELRKSSMRVHASQLALLIPCMFLLVVFLFLMTAPYAQSALLFAPMLAIYGAVALRKSLDGILMPQTGVDETKSKRFGLRAKRLLFFTGTVAAGFIIPGTMIILKAHPFSGTNTEQFKRMEYVLKVTQPTDAVFDGESAYVFRPQAYYYSALFHAIVWRIEGGGIKQDIPQSLISTNCRVMIYDERVATLPQSVQLFLRANYEPSEVPEVYLAKKQLNR
ncbi:MAG TPA: glycosyltransferase family 39 protein [Pyrinomonadaceae bacterium]|jgi:hypothetical protein|nr:glycosyltransferase family 39 protein [Pyrinomonadaceae bacterium]